VESARIKKRAESSQAYPSIRLLRDLHITKNWCKRWGFLEETLIFGNLHDGLATMRAELIADPLDVAVDGF
jgi:hypothetical protein